MQYMLLIYEDESNPPPDDAEMGKWFVVTVAMKEAGVHVAGEALHPTSAATTVRVKGGEIVTTDGPFAETKEQLGGYYLVDVADIDAAIEWAGRMPNAHKRSIEVAPAPSSGIICRIDWMRWPDRSRTATVADPPTHHTGITAPHGAAIQSRRPPVQLSLKPARGPRLDAPGRPRTA